MKNFEIRGVKSWCGAKARSVLRVKSNSDNEELLEGCGKFLRELFFRKFLFIFETKKIFEKKKCVIIKWPKDGMSIMEREHWRKRTKIWRS